MSAGPFGDRTRADLANKRLNNWLATDGFSNTLVELLKLLSSLPDHPNRPDKYLNEMLGIPQSDTGNEMLMEMLNKARQQLVEELEENRRLRLRNEQLNEMYSNDIHGDVNKVVQQFKKDTETHK